MAVRSFRGMIIGPPGAGKGTISEKISETFKIRHIATGDILRTNVAKKTDLGKLVNEYLTEGTLVPDRILNQCMVEEIKKGGDRFLLDGYPRTIHQAQNLATQVQLDTCIYLNVPFHIIIKRLSTRWTHIPSGRVYNRGFRPPKVQRKDDVTGEDLVRRDDDKPKAVIKRLEVYESTTKPMLEYYKKINILNEFGSSGSNDLWPEVKAFIEKKLK